VKVWAFLDESGDPNLDVEAGATTHFVAAAVIVPEAHLEKLRTDIEAVRVRHFQTGKIKSSSVASPSAEGPE